MRPSNELASDLALAMTRLRARLRNQQATVAAGHSMSQISALGRIAEMGPLTTSALAHAEHLRPQSMAEIVAVLKRDNLVAAHPDPNDGRKTLLSLTDDGTQMVDSIISLRGSWLADAIDATITRDDRAVLEKAVEILDELSHFDSERR